MSTSHVTLPGSDRPAKPGATRLRDIAPDTQIEVTVTIRGPALPGTDEHPMPALSAAEFASRYAASQQDADAVARVLGEHGLAVRKVDLVGRSVIVSGPADAMESAFRPGLGVYHHPEQGEYRGREGTVSIPAGLEGVVTGVFGLDQRRVMRRRSTGALAADTPAAAQHSWGPADMEAFYSFPPGDGAGQAIVIGEFGGVYQSDDLQKYSNKYGLPALNIDTVTLNPTLGDASDYTGEVMMDVEIVAGLCPAAQISIVFTSFDQKGCVDLVNHVINTPPVVLSVSWGESEDGGAWTSDALKAVNERLQAAAALGITVCVAAGDDGSLDLADEGDGSWVDDGRAHVNFPASNPWVLSVGGTMLVETADGAEEHVWYEPNGYRKTDRVTQKQTGGATGGGVSTLCPRSTWQNVHIPSKNPGSIDGRVVPDVAALAGWPGYFVVISGQDYGMGGTSAATPLWASLIARVNAALPPAQRQRFLAPLLYQAGPDGKIRGAQACRDITQGDNSSPVPGRGYAAGPGFDAVTGWGTPIGTQLLSVLGS